MNSLPSAVQRSVLAVTALPSVGLQQRPEPLPPASSSEAAAAPASGGRAGSAQGHLTKGRKNYMYKLYDIEWNTQHIEWNDSSSVIWLKRQKSNVEQRQKNTPVFWAWPIATLMPATVTGSVVTPAVATETTGGFVRVTWAVCPAWVWIWPCVGTRVCNRK